MVKRIIDLDYSAEQRKATLLHISLCRSPVESSRRTPIPSVPIVKLLLSCGAPINARDSHRNTPLHMLARNQYEDYSDKQLNDIKTIFEMLLTAGAHLDAIGAAGTPEQCSKYDEIQSLFRAHPIQLSLKCLCARIIRRKHINYKNTVPKHLYSFIELH
jgi:ankyrin repeat protein